MFNCKHLLVDGWNVIHATKDMKIALIKGEAELAQKKLLQVLANIHDSQNIRVSIVYDGKGEDIQIERPTKVLTFSEVYTPSSMTADELIEQFCANTKNAEDLLVASADNMVRLTASGFEVPSIHPETLINWASGAKSNISRKVFLNKSGNENSWKSANPFNALDDFNEELKLAAKLVELRHKEDKSKARKESVQKENLTPSAPSFAELLDGKPQKKTFKLGAAGRQKAKPLTQTPQTLKSLEDLTKAFKKKS